MKKPKIFIACDTTNLTKVKKLLKILKLIKLRLVINLAWNS